MKTWQGTPGSAAPLRPRPAAGGFGLLSLGFFIGNVDLRSSPPLLIPIAHALQMSVGAITVIATVYLLSFGAMLPVYGILSDRIGRVRVMRWGLIGVCVGDLLSAVAPNLGVLIVGRAIAGGCAAALLPTTMVYLGDTVPFGQRQRVIANVLAVGAVGTAIGILGAGLLARFVTWRLAFAIPAVAALVLALVFGRLPESLAGQRGTGPITQVRRVFRSGWATFLVGFAFVEGAVMLGFFTFFAPALEAHGESAAIAGVVVAAYSVAVIGGTQIVKRLTRRGAAARLIALGGVLLMIGYAIAALDQGIVAILLGGLVIGLAYASLHSTVQTWSTQVVPEARGTATSLVAAGVFIGAAIGTAAVSGLANAHRYQLLFVVALAITLPVVIVGALARARYESLVIAWS